jgi:lysophospholipase L1-like esterase
MGLAAKLVLGPLLVAQALATRRRLPRLPEAEGAREGVAGDGPVALRLLIGGDSSAAGVGVATQDQALAGHTVRALAERVGGAVAWRLVARSGLTTAQCADLLIEAAPPWRADVAVFALGVNDVIDLVPPRRALAARERLVAPARALRRAPRRVHAAAAGAPLPWPAAAAALGDGCRRAPSRRRAGALGAAA